MFSYKKVKILKLHKGGACNTFPVLEDHSLKQTRLPYIKISRICRHSRQSVVSNPSACRMVESRTLYVRAKESVLIALSALSIKKAIRRIPPVFLGEHTDPSIVC